MTVAVIGVDIGTHSVKGVLITADGAVVAQAGSHHAVGRPEPGWFEHHAETVWWDGVRAVVRDLVAASDIEVVAVGLSACGPCVVPVDRAGQPLRAGILYGVDTRASEQVARFEVEFPTEAAIERFGMPFTSQSVAPKLEWLAETEATTAARTATVLTANGYVAFRLTGRRCIDHHQAAYFAPYYAHGQWQPGAGSWSSKLPALVWSDEVVGTVTESAAAATGLRVGLPVVMGSSDGLTDAVAVGAVDPGHAVLRYGSTMGLTVLVDKPIGGPGVWLTPGTRAGQFAAVTGQSASGAITEWFRSEFARDLPQGDDTEIVAAHDLLITEAEQSPRGSAGLLFLPYLAGERSPIYDPGARGVLLGLQLTHRRGDVYRAILEGTAYNLRHLLQVLAESGTTVGTGAPVRSVGGGTRRRFWPQIVADVCGLTQELLAADVGAHFGAARLAAEAVGAVERDHRPWATPAQTVRPAPEAGPFYTARFALYQQLYGGTRSLISQLDALSG